MTQTTRKIQGTRVIRRKPEIPKNATGQELHRTDGPAEAASGSKRWGRRRQIDPTTCEREYTSEEIEFMQALEAYKRRSGRMFPTCSEILEVFRNLGYRRVVPEGAISASR